jgi:hypothetical protein
MPVKAVMEYSTVLILSPSKDATPSIQLARSLLRRAPIHPNIGKSRGREETK